MVTLKSVLWPLKLFNEGSRAMRKFKKGDQVLAIAGNEKGRTGTILSIDGERAIVQGLNVRKKHVKAQGNQKGQILEIEAPIHVSNLSVCDAKGKLLKLKVRFNEEGKKELYHMDGDKAVAYRTVK